MDYSFWFLMVLVVGSLVWKGISAIHSHWYGRKRTERMEQVAEKLGLTFVPKRDGEVPSVLAKFQIFQRGCDKRITNTLQGKFGDAKLAVFDYRYTIVSHGENGSSETHYHQSVVYVHSPKLTLPEFTLVPERLLHKVGSVFGFQDIDFETHPTFSKKYLLRGKEEKAIRDLFDEDVLQFFERQSKISCEGRNDCFIIYHSGVRIKSDNLRRFVNDGLRLRTLFRSTQRQNDEL